MNDNTGRCALAHTRDPDRPRPATHGLLCTGHYRDLEQTISEMPALVGEVEPSLVRASMTGGPKVGGTREQPLPYNDKVSNTLRRTRDTLASWAGLVVDNHPDHLHKPRFGTLPTAMFLHRHLDWISHQDWISDFRSEILERRRELHQAMSDPRTKRVDLGPCDSTVSCDITTHDEVTCAGIMRAVVSTEDDLLPAEIACTVCGLTKEPSEWRALSRRLRGDEDPMLTFSQLSQLHRIPVGTLKRWAQEDQWRRDDPTRPSDPKHYHLGDAQASVDRHATKRQEAS